MNRLSSVSDTSYAYLATLSRLDTNGDGVLSITERAADEKPGILQQLSEDNGTSQSTVPKFSANVLAFMMESGSVSKSDAGNDHVGDVYGSTYGQYDTVS